MYKNTINSKFIKKLKSIIIITSILSLVLITNTTFLYNSKLDDRKNDDLKNEKNIFTENLKISNGNPILFEGTEQSINITDNGNLFKNNQHISLENQELLNINYYLDDIHGWKASKIETSIRNIQDKRNWINNSGFQSPTIYRVYGNWSTEHPYPNGQNKNWNNPTPDHEIFVSNALYIRVHFFKVQFELDYDYMYISNGSNDMYYVNSSGDTDFYSPWVHGDTIRLFFESDGTINDYGYEVDYYEFVNSSSNFNINSAEWQFNYLEVTNGFNDHGTANVGNSTAMYVALYGEFDPDFPEEFSYETDAFSEIHQDFDIPSGPVVEAYLSFEYYCQYALPTNDHYLYVELNDQKIFSKGMLDITELGKRKWLSSGKLYTDAWDNLTAIFEENVYQQQFNISLGFKVGAGYTYTGVSNEGLMNIIYFDNVSLVVTTEANSTQNGINLRIDDENLNDENVWGHSNKTLLGFWDSNPITITLNSTSPFLTFDMNTTVYGYRNGSSMINQQGTEGVKYQILNNGSIYWEFLHNFYVPSEYSDMEFTIGKPKEWDFLFVKDSTLQNIPFELGKFGDSTLKVNKSYALFPGWWTFSATSPNYIENINTQMFKLGQWGHPTFSTGETTKIRTQINNSNEIPPNLALTLANLTIYDPSGLIWYEESTNPLSNGTVVFSDITFTALNSIGGQYNYTIFWSNGTAIGGVKSEFILNHHSSLTLLKPDDAELDLRTEGTVGDLIYVQILLEDSENNLTIPDSEISYNWTDGTRFFTELGLGIYETLLDTEDLLTLGLHNIIIKSNKTGFFECNITLEINLGETTNLQVLESEEDIELHANSTIRFKYTNYAEIGIEGALVNISISNSSLYSIDDEGGGVYSIEFSTLFIDTVGTYELRINFSATGYEPQYYKYQFDIVKQSVNLSVFINSVEKSENSGVQTAFNEQLNISVRAISNIDREYLTGGVITCRSLDGSYQKNLTIYPNFWYNTTITCSPENFSWGDHSYLLEFNHPNYKTATFGFNLFVDRIEIDVVPIGFEDTIDAEVGKTVSVQIQLMDPNTANPIENAIITYIWEGGFGYINQTIPGTYETDIELPESLYGNFRVDLIINPNNTIYKSTQYSFILVISDPNPRENNLPPLLFWIIIGILVAIAGILGMLSLRSYVFMPRRRKKEAELLSKTQRFKDLKNIQAIVIIHKLSGIPIYSNSYSILERHNKELFSGFIQAITTVGEEFSEKEKKIPESKESPTPYGVEKILELDFKYFYCLIADKEEVRVVFILREKASERLKSQISNLVLALNLKLSQDLDNWDGSLDYFEEAVPPIVNEYFELYYKGTFSLSSQIDLLKMRKEKSLEKLEIRVLNVIQSVSKRNNNIINLDDIIKLVHEENKDLIIEALEVLIEKKLITPINP